MVDKKKTAFIACLIQMTPAVDEELIKELTAELKMIYCRFDILFLKEVIPCRKSVWAEIPNC